MSSDLSKLEQPAKAILGWAVAASFIWGSLGKIFIYDHFRNFKLSERPINVLILKDELINHMLIAYRFIFPYYYLFRSLQDGK
jgi:hypothetical protein